MGWTRIGGMGGISHFEQLTLVIIIERDQGTPACNLEDNMSVQDDDIRLVFRGNVCTKKKENRPISGCFYLSYLFLIDFKTSNMTISTNNRMTMK